MGGINPSEAAETSHDFSQKVLPSPVIFLGKIFFVKHQTILINCDDVNITTEKLEDFEVVSNVVKRFEKVSGAILSRNKKCKVIGFGNWATKVDWPLVWIKPVKFERIFRIFICDIYERTSL